MWCSLKRKLKFYQVSGKNISVIILGYYYAIWNYYPSLCASNSEKAVQINVQEGYHTVLGARFVSLVNQVPYCLGNILHTTIILNPGNTTARNLNIIKQRLGD